MILVANTEAMAAEFKKMYPGIEVILSKPVPVTRGTIELKQNRKAKRAAAPLNQGDK